jgi:hypothetical protein
MIAAAAARLNMRRRRMRWLALVAVLMAGGCATDVGPSPAELKAQWEAQNVFPQNYKADLMAYIRTYLNDPTHIRATAVSQPQLKTMGPDDRKRYVACVRYNARVDGKYAGSKDGAAIYVSGKLDRFLDAPLEVREFCKDAAYAPFPELETLTR